MRWPQVVFRGFQVLGHLTKHDLLSVDAIVDKSVAPDILLSASHRSVACCLQLVTSLSFASYFLFACCLVYSTRPAWIFVCLCLPAFLAPRCSLIPQFERCDGLLGRLGTESPSL